jgi:hypothetical protein
MPSGIWILTFWSGQIPLHIFVIPVQIHHVLGNIGVQTPHHMYELEATAFRNFGN